MRRAIYRPRREAEAIFIASDRARTRWWKRVQPGGADECWEWQGYRDPDGYGELAALGGPVRAHRVSWVIAHGTAIPDGGHVLHACDNPPCVNPAHLSVDTNAANARDRAQKGRTQRFRGETNAAAVLTEDAVREIRQRRAAGETLASLARAHGVAFQTIGKICDGSRWRHVG